MCRPNTDQKRAKLFSRYPHLKKFGPSKHKRESNGPQQSEAENLVKVNSTEEKVPDFSAYTKKDASKPGDISRISDQSDDSLEQHEMDDSFERDDDCLDIETENIELWAEKRKPHSVIIDDERKQDAKVKINNQNILNFLDSSLAIDINKPKNLEEEEKEKEVSKIQETDSDISLIESSNSLNLRFYDTEKESSNSVK